MLVEDVLYGALTSGVNKPTVLLLNVALIGCIFSLGALLALSINGAPALVPHVAFLLFLAIGLFFLINWFLTQVGTVDTAQQRNELFGPSGVAGSLSLAEKQPASDPLQEATPATIISTSTGIKKTE
ncbi:g7684 [Coccomyxa elongata]